MAKLKKTTMSNQALKKHLKKSGGAITNLPTKEKHRIVSSAKRSTKSKHPAMKKGSTLDTNKSPFWRPSKTKYNPADTKDVTRIIAAFSRKGKKK